MNNKKVFSLFLAFAIVLTLGLFQATPAFAISKNDVKSYVQKNASNIQESVLEAKTNTSYQYTGYRGIKLSSWAQTPANIAALLGLMPEEVMDYFAEPISRKDFAILVANSLSVLTSMSYEELESGVRGTSFKDYNSIETRICSALGIISGYSNGNFLPDGLITRQEAATMLARLADVTGCTSVSTPATFRDTAGKWGASYMSQVSTFYDPILGSNVMGGVGSSSFDPDGYYTREQALVTIVRMVGATASSHTGYGRSSQQVSPKDPKILPIGDYVREDGTCFLRITNKGGEVCYSVSSQTTGNLEGIDQTGTIQYNPYIEKLEAEEGLLYFSKVGNSIKLETDWLDEMYYIYNLFDGLYYKQ